MSQHPPAARTEAQPASQPTPQDVDHLNLLAIFHYVYGGLGLLFGFFPLIYGVLGMAMFTQPSAFDDADQEMIATMGLVFTVIAGAVTLYAWVLSSLILYAGRCLQTRRHRMFCCVIAGINCLSVPLGTLLGVFTLVVLTRPSVKAMFDAPAT